MAIKVNKTNPFITGYVINYPEGDSSLERTKLSYVPSVDDKLHTVRVFDTLWDLSYDNYGTSRYWWIIADINDIEDPYTLTTNTNLIVPALDKIKNLIL